MGWWGVAGPAPRARPPSRPAPAPFPHHAPRRVAHLVEFVDAAHALVGQDERARFKHHLPRLGVFRHVRRQADRRRPAPRRVDAARRQLVHVTQQLGLAHAGVAHQQDVDLAARAARRGGVGRGRAARRGARAAGRGAALAHAAEELAEDALFDVVQTPDGGRDRGREAGVEVGRGGERGELGRARGDRLGRPVRLGPPRRAVAAGVDRDVHDVDVGAVHGAQGRHARVDAQRRGLVHARHRHPVPRPRRVDALVEGEQGDRVRGLARGDVVGRLLWGGGGRPGGGGGGGRGGGGGGGGGGGRRARPRRRTAATPSPPLRAPAS